MNSIILFLFSSFLSTTAFALNINSAEYNPSTKELWLHVAYQGVADRHTFSLEWGECEKLDGVNTMSARLIDHDGEEEARESFEQTLVFDTAAVDCRPVFLTVRSGRVAQVSIFLEN